MINKSTRTFSLEEGKQMSKEDKEKNKEIMNACDELHQLELQTKGDPLE
jgi:hypothetical protein